MIIYPNPPTKKQIEQNERGAKRYKKLKEKAKKQILSLLEKNSKLTEQKITEALNISRELTILSLYSLIDENKVSSEAGKTFADNLYLRNIKE